MYWLLGRKSKLSTSNKPLTILKPIWIYGIQLWDTASTSNIEILERFQSKALRMIVDAPWYVPNTVIRRDLKIPTVKEEIRRYNSQSVLASVHTGGLEPISYRGVLVSTLPHPFAHVFTQFAECTNTGCR
jgi:hypothetical protein